MGDELRRKAMAFVAGRLGVGGLASMVPLTGGTIKFNQRSLRTRA
jgi:hypothetical protein